MALLKIRGADGVVREVVALKGEPGGYAPHTHSSDEINHENGKLNEVLNDITDTIERLDVHTHELTEITCEGYGTARDYVDLVKEQAELAESIANAATQSAGDALEYAEGVNSKLSSVEELADELNAGLVRLEDETIPSISETANTAQRWAQEAQETAQTAQNDAVTAQRKADDVAEQIGGIEAAVDGIINIQNILIGGGA